MRTHLHRLAFIDETSMKTNMTKLTGWAPRGERLIDHAPFGHWNTQTFIAALRHDRLDAPWVIKGAMDREAFNLYIETQLAPTLQPGEVVILDNLNVHKSATAQALLKAQKNWLLFLPKYSPDLNRGSARSGLKQATGLFPGRPSPPLRWPSPNSRH